MLISHLNSIPGWSLFENPGLNHGGTAVKTQSAALVSKGSILSQPFFGIELSCNDND